MEKIKEALIEKLVVGDFEANCYIFACAQTKIAAIIDPGADSEKILKIITKEKILPKLIINTHGHIDHIGANAKFNLPIYIHRLDADFLKDPDKNLSAYATISFEASSAKILLEEGDKIDVGNLQFKVIHIPGHTPGGIALLYENIIFTGDTLFKEGIGRADFPYSEGDALFKSIKEKLMILSDDTIIFPGHGSNTTIGYERKHNPFLIERR